MGSYNQTCFLTSLPIIENELVVSILLIQNNVLEVTPCYSNTYYRPVPLTFSGRYNGYGYLEDCKGTYLHIIEKYLGCDIYSFFEKNHQLDSFVKDWQDENVFVTPIFIKKKVFDYFIEKYQYENYNGITVSYSTLIDSHKNCLENGNLPEFIDEYCREDILSQFKSTDLVYQEVAKIAMLEIFLNDSRKLWIRPCGIGSQNDSIKSQLFSNKLVAMCTKMEYNTNIDSC